MNLKFDIIGDVHGHADKLIKLLITLGYQQQNGVWSHPSRILLSVGDLIDRGPQQREVIDILKPMQQAGKAIVIMGNHEFNAVSWWRTDENGQPLRPHSEKNYRQHEAFLLAADADKAWYNDTMAWFETLPVLFENDDICCVHAAWDTDNITCLKTLLNADMTFKPHQWAQANTKGHPLYEAVEYCLKGPDIALPRNKTFVDGGNVTRHKMRLKWWNINASSTYQSSSVSVPNPHLLPDDPLPAKAINNELPDKPVFFGHYWMTGKPHLLSDKIVCLDWSVVIKDGHLVAYSYDGESTLDTQKLTWV